jgi:uncharacterized damage-inducible protein DinB
MDARDLFAYVVTLRWRLLDALRDAPPELLHREMGTNYRTIMQTLVHVLAVEQSWIDEDIRGNPALNWQDARHRYLGGEASGEERLDTLIRGWRQVTGETLECLRSEAELGRLVALEGPPDNRAATVDQIIFHLAGEEMIHMGEVLAMTRQLGINLPSYFLMSIMSRHDRPWQERSATGTVTVRSRHDP